MTSRGCAHAVLLFLARRCLICLGDLPGAERQLLEGVARGSPGLTPLQDTIKLLRFKLVRDAVEKCQVGSMHHCTPVAINSVHLS